MNFNCFTPPLTRKSWWLRRQWRW